METHLTIFLLNLNDEDNIFYVFIHLFIMFQRTA